MLWRVTCDLQCHVKYLDRSTIWCHNQLTASCYCTRTRIHIHIALDLSHNQLSSLPDDFSLLHLLHLNLSSNLFLTFPATLRLMPALISVDLSSNRLTEVHNEDLTAVQNLESVDLRGNPLRPEVKALLQSMVRVEVMVEDPEEQWRLFTAFFFDGNNLIAIQSMCDSHIFCGCVLKMA